jgi:hypothetical protein
VYHIGLHPDDALKYWYGENVAVLVVDENVAGVYDKVYVDLNNKDFTDDKPCFKGDEIAWVDLDGDGEYWHDLDGNVVVNEGKWTHRKSIGTHMDIHLERPLRLECTILSRDLTTESCSEFSIIGERGWHL